jgi:hypothetical protein
MLTSQFSGRGSIKYCDEGVRMKKKETPFNLKIGQRWRKDTNTGGGGSADSY